MKSGGGFEEGREGAEDAVATDGIVVPGCHCAHAPHFKSKHLYQLNPERGNASKGMIAMKNTV
jgi:hypothetical protein